LYTKPITNSQNSSVHGPPLHTRCIHFTLEKTAKVPRTEVTVLHLNISIKL